MKDRNWLILLVVSGIAVYLALEYLAKEVKAATLPSAETLNTDNTQ